MDKKWERNAGEKRVLTRGIKWIEERKQNLNVEDMKKLIFSKILVLHMC
jgi:hypothetical protein